MLSPAEFVETHRPAGGRRSSKRDFIVKVRLAGLWEIPAGNMAVEKSEDPRIVNIGKTIAQQHVVLDKLDIAKNTIVVYTTDNGAEHSADFLSIACAFDHAVIAFPGSTRVADVVRIVLLAPAVRFGVRRRLRGRRREHPPDHVDDRQRPREERRRVDRDRRPRAAIDAAQAFADGGERSKALRDSAWAAHRAAQETRDMRMSEAEKKAAALPPKLTVPMILFFLPVLFVVIMTPAMIQVFGWC